MVVLAACLVLAGCGGGGPEGSTATTAVEPLGARPLVPRTQPQFQGDLDGLGPLWGYLAGWGFVVGKTASCAAMALTFGAYAAPTVARPVSLTLAAL